MNTYQIKCKTCENIVVTISIEQEKTPEQLEEMRKDYICQTCLDNRPPMVSKSLKAPPPS